MGCRFVIAHTNTWLRVFRTMLPILIRILNVAQTGLKPPEAGDPEICRGRGPPVDEYVEITISSCKTSKQLRIDELVQMLDEADALIVTELGRLGRSTAEVIAVAICKLMSVLQTGAAHMSDRARVWSHRCLRQLPCSQADFPSLQFIRLFRKAAEGRWMT